MGVTGVGVVIGSRSLRSAFTGRHRRVTRHGHLHAAVTRRVHGVEPGPGQVARGPVGRRRPPRAPRRRRRGPTPAPGARRPPGPPRPRPGRAAATLRVRRARTSSMVMAISWRTAHSASTRRWGSPGRAARAARAGPTASVEHGRGLAAVAADQRRQDVLVQPEAGPPRPGRAAPRGPAAPRSARRLVRQRRARPAPRPEALHHDVHGVLGHPAVGGELAPGHRDHAVGRHAHRVAPRQVGGAVAHVMALGRCEQRSQARPHRR